MAVLDPVETLPAVTRVLLVTQRGAFIHKHGERLVISVRGEPDAPEFFELNDNEHPLNISHGYCADCQPIYEEQVRAQHAELQARRRAADEQAKAERAEQRRTRFRRGRKDSE